MLYQTTQYTSVQVDLDVDGEVEVEVEVEVQVEVDGDAENMDPVPPHINNPSSREYKLYLFTKCSRDVTTIADTFDVAISALVNTTNDALLISYIDTMSRVLHTACSLRIQSPVDHRQVRPDTFVEFLYHSGLVAAEQKRLGTRYPDRAPPGDDPLIARKRICINMMSIIHDMIEFSDTSTVPCFINNILVLMAGKQNMFYKPDAATTPQRGKPFTSSTVFLATTSYNHHSLLHTLVRLLDYTMLAPLRKQVSIPGDADTPSAMGYATTDLMALCISFLTNVMANRAVEVMTNIIYVRFHSAGTCRSHVEPVWNSRIESNPSAIDSPPDTHPSVRRFYRRFIDDIHELTDILSGVVSVFDAVSAIEYGISLANACAIARTRLSDNFYHRIVLDGTTEAITEFIRIVKAPEGIIPTPPLDGISKLPKKIINTRYTLTNSHSTEFRNDILTCIFMNIPIKDLRVGMPGKTNISRLLRHSFLIPLIFTLTPVATGVKKKSKRSFPTPPDTIKFHTTTKLTASRHPTNIDDIRLVVDGGQHDHPDPPHAAVARRRQRLDQAKQINMSIQFNMNSYSSIVGSDGGISFMNSTLRDPGILDSMDSLCHALKTIYEAVKKLTNNRTSTNRIRKDHSSIGVKVPMVSTVDSLFGSHMLRLDFDCSTLQLTITTNIASKNAYRLGQVYNIILIAIRHKMPFWARTFYADAVLCITDKRCNHTHFADLGNCIVAANDVRENYLVYQSDFHMDDKTKPIFSIHYLN